MLTYADASSLTYADVCCAVFRAWQLMTPLSAMRRLSYLLLPMITLFKLQVFETDWNEGNATRANKPQRLRTSRSQTTGVKTTLPGPTSPKSIKRLNSKCLRSLFPRTSRVRSVETVGIGYPHMSTSRHLPASHERLRAFKCSFFSGKNAPSLAGVQMLLL
jgi:hypothetical protein